MFRVSKGYFSPSLSVIASACFLLIGTNSLAVTQNLSGAGSTNQANAQYQQQQRQEQIRQQQLQMQQQLAQARQAEQARQDQSRQQQVQMQQELAQKRQAEQARQDQTRQQQLQTQQQLAQARQAEQARQQQVQMQQQLAQARQAEQARVEQARQQQLQYQQQLAQARQAEQARQEQIRQQQLQMQQQLAQARQAEQARLEQARQQQLQMQQQLAQVRQQQAAKNTQTQQSNSQNITKSTYQDPYNSKIGPPTQPSYQAKTGLLGGQYIEVPKSNPALTQAGSLSTNNATINQVVPVGPGVAERTAAYASTHKADIFMNGAAMLLGPGEARVIGGVVKAGADKLTEKIAPVVINQAEKSFAKRNISNISNLQGGLQTTAHGAERIAGNSATRGGVLSESSIQSVRQSGKMLTQADGAVVKILSNNQGKFDVVVEGKKGIITTFENLSQNSLDRLGKNYGWK